MEEQATIQKEVSREESPVIKVSKELNKDDDIVTLSTGYRAKIKVVAATLIDDVISMVKPPEVPVWYNEEKGREEPNPSDPEYLNALIETERKRNTLAMDTMIMFGVELVDEVPDDSEWLNKLRFMERRGVIDLSNYDLNNKEEKEFLFKRYIAVGVSDLNLITNKSGITNNDIKKAEESFRS